VSIGYKTKWGKIPILLDNEHLPFFRWFILTQQLRQVSVLGLS